LQDSIVRYAQKEIKDFFALCTKNCNIFTTILTKEKGLGTLGIKSNILLTFIPNYKVEKFVV